MEHDMLSLDQLKEVHQKTDDHQCKINQHGCRIFGTMLWIFSRMDNIATKTEPTKFEDIYDIHGHKGGPFGQFLFEQQESVDTIRTAGMYDHIYSFDIDTIADCLLMAAEVFQGQAHRWGSSNAMEARVAIAAVKDWAEFKEENNIP